MAEVEDSILTSVKKNLGLESDYDAFDAEVGMHINSALSTLSQLGFGPDGGFLVTGNEETWSQFVPDATKQELGQITAYVYLKVRNLFDPPSTSYVMAAFSNQIQELESRLSMMREGRDWVNPMPAVVSPSDDL